MVDFELAPLGMCVCLSTCTISNNPNRCDVPPPIRWPSLSSVRKLGTVLRVSKIFDLLVPTARTFSENIEQFDEHNFCFFQQEENHTERNIWHSNVNTGTSPQRRLEKRQVLRTLAYGYGLEKPTWNHSKCKLWNICLCLGTRLEKWVWQFGTQATASLIIFSINRMSPLGT